MHLQSLATTLGTHFQLLVTLLHKYLVIHVTLALRRSLDDLLQFKLRIKMWKKCDLRDF